MFEKPAVHLVSFFELILLLLCVSVSDVYKGTEDNLCAREISIRLAGAIAFCINGSYVCVVHSSFVLNPKFISCVDNKIEAIFS